jgi:hypothetical protein
MRSLRWWFDRDAIPPTCVLLPAPEAFGTVQSVAGAGAERRSHLLPHPAFPLQPCNVCGLHLLPFLAPSLTDLPTQVYLGDAFPLFSAGPAGSTQPA